MARTLDGVDDFVTLAVGAGNITAPLSLVALCRQAVTGADTVIAAMKANTDSDPTYSMFLDSSGRVSMSSDGPEAYGVTAIGTGWVLIAVTKASGTATPRMHLYTYSTNVWVHENAGGTLANPPLGVTTVRLGRTYDTGGQFFEGQFLLAGVFSVVLTDAQIELMAFSLIHWHSLSPKALWLLDQSLTSQAIGDLTGGGANQTAITGTAVATNHPPVFNRYALWTPPAAPAAAAGQPTRRRWGGVPHQGEGRRVGRSW